MINTDSDNARVNSNLPRVIFYIPALDSGGPQQVFYELLRAMPRTEIEPVLLTNNGEGALRQKVEALGVEVYSLDSASRYPFKEFFTFLRGVDADLVICTLNSIITAAVAKLLYRIPSPIIARPANHLTQSSRELFRKNPLKYGLAWAVNVLSLHVAKHIVCQSEDIKIDLKRYLVPARRLSVIGNPVPPSVIRSTSREFVGEPQGHLKLVSLGRLTRQKGYDILVEAVSMLHPKCKSKITVDIYGDGPDHKRLEEMICQYQLESVIRLHGYTDQVCDVLGSADFFISSSRYEGFPNAVLEALAYGLSVIATDCPGGTRELVIPEKTGWLADSGSASALAKAICQACDEGPMEQEPIRKFIQHKFSPESIACEYVQIFKKFGITSDDQVKCERTLAFLLFRYR